MASRGQCEESEWDRANVFRQFSFAVTNPLLDVGQSRTLQHDDLYSLAKHDRVERLLAVLRDAYNSVRKGGRFWSRIMIAHYRANRQEFWVTAAYTISESAVRIVQPVLLRMLLVWLEDDSKSIAQGMAIAVPFGLMGVFQTLAHHVLFYYTMRAGWNLRNSSTALIQEKLLSMPTSALLDTSSGQLVNLVSNDVQRFDEFCIQGHFFWMSFVDVAVVTALIALQIGVIPAFCGVAIIFLLVPMQFYLGNRFGLLRRKTALHTDARVRHTAEVIRSISSVKSFAWETPFMNLLGGLRDKEVSYIRRSQLCKAFNSSVFLAVPILASFATFTAMWALGEKLEKPDLLFTLSMLQVLRTSVGRQWTRSIETGSEAAVSGRRIQKFLDLADQQSGDTTVGRTVVEKIDNDPDLVLKVQDANFYYQSPDDPVLKRISFDVKRGEILMVVGQVGSGKSSLLMGCLGELRHCAPKDAEGGGKIFQAANTRIAYCAQQPWILASSVRSNITIAGPRGGASDADAETKTSNDIEAGDMDEERYNAALDACMLRPDMAQWPNSDETQIGERGVTVSGGQKARISLARAVYADADLYLLDDPLSAVDANVSRHLFTNCIKKYLAGEKNKAVILVSHQLQYLDAADKVLWLSATGEVLAYGPPSDIHIPRNTSVSPDEIDHEPQPDGTAEVTSPQPEGQTEEGAAITAAPSPAASAAAPAASPRSHQVFEQEDRVVGKVTRETYMEYLRSGGVAAGLGVLGLCVLGQLFVLASDYWLVVWSEQGNQRKPIYVIIFAVLTVAATGMGFSRSVAFFRWCLKASSTMHARAVYSLLHAPMTFFIANPTGRILNRFSKDQNIVDELMPMTLFDFIQSALFVLAAVVLVCVSLPVLLALLAPLVYGFYVARRRFLASSREIKRLEAVSRSPVYADFSATIQGLVTIRAYGLQQAVQQRFISLINDNARAWYCFLLVSRWLGFRLDLIAALFLFAAAVLVVPLRSTIDVGITGFALVYALSLSSLFQWTVRLSAESENQMTSTERVLKYAHHLEPEPGYAPEFEDAADAAHDARTAQPPKEISLVELTRWPSKGALQVQNLTVTYRPDLPPVLENLSFEILGGSKVGVVGRTGAGKSTLLMALLRLNQVTSGDILLDGVSLLSIDLKKARSAMAYIPQDPHLFSGTLRFNLDPFNLYSDAKIWDMLEAVQLKEVVSSTPEGLDALVGEDGSNWSVGQRQLLSLARALLRECKVIVCDEATANVDYETDAIIQRVFRESPIIRRSTVITIAHRLRTVGDSDLIIVLEKGRLHCMGAPAELLSFDNTFSQMVERSGERDTIVELAMSAQQRHSSVSSSNAV